jgi:uncharacterized membrane protein
MIKATGYYLIFILTLFLAGIAKAAVEKGTIRGRIINGTNPHRVLADQEVILYSQKEDKTVSKKVTKTDPQGNFSFEDLPTASGNRYQVSTIYHEVPYFTEVMRFDPEKDSITAKDLFVYELTDNPDQIRIQREHLVLDAPEYELSVTDIVIIENMGNKTFWAKGEDKGLKFPLPKGFSNFRGVGKVINDPSDPGQSLYLYTKPIPPGIKRVFFAYKVDFTQRHWVMAKKFLYSTPQLDLFLTDEGLQLQSPDLIFQGYQDMGQKRFLVWQGSNFKAGTNLMVEIAAPLPIGYWVYNIIGYGFIVLIIILGFSYPLIESKFGGRDKTKADNSVAGEELKNLHKKKKKLLHLTASLDDKFAAGNISESEYRTLRDKNKQQLIAIAQKLEKYAD